MKMNITSMSTKGQVVIPRDIRHTLGLVSGSKFAIFTDGARILLQPLRPTDSKAFRRLVKEGEAAIEKAKKKGGKQ